MKCINCGKEISYNFGTSDMSGNYCKSCWENFNNEVVLKVLEQKDHQIAELKKALELACEPRDDWGGREYDDPYTNSYDYFLDKAKEMLKNE